MLLLFSFQQPLFHLRTVLHKMQKLPQRKHKNSRLITFNYNSEDFTISLKLNNQLLVTSNVNLK